jgi:predicted nucleic acid-binding protein
MKIFLDANILVSVLNKEYPVFSYSSRVLSLADDQKFELSTSALCLAIAFYFAEKKSGTRLAKNKIELLSQKLKILDVGNEEVVKAIANNKVLDFEDGLEYYAAQKNRCKYIITEDISDYHFAEIAVLDSKSFIERLIKQKL